MSTLPIPADASNFQAWCAAQSAIRDVRDLVAGNGPFQQMTVEERAQALQSILGAIESAPSLLFPGLTKCDDQTVIGIVSDDATPPEMLYEAAAELFRRIADEFSRRGAAAPTPAERDEIESIIIQSEEAEAEPEPFDGLS